MMEKDGWVYILANRPGGKIYTGVTANLPLRMEQHRAGQGSLFVKRYNLIRLVYWEQMGEIEAAIRREKAIKRWTRAWKIELIESVNPTWEDLTDRMNW